METDLLLVTVTEAETTAVFKVFFEATKQNAHPVPVADKVFHNLGTINGTKVFLVQSEMGAGGLGAAQQTVQKGIEAISPAAVIMVGIAFGVNKKKQEIGDILVARQLVLYDFQRVGTKIKGESRERNFVLRDDRPHCSAWLFDAFRGATHYWKGQSVHVGQVLSGEKLIDNLDYREELIELTPEAIGGEMEGRGLYVACQDKKVDWILVKAISDWADGKKGRDKKAKQELAATNAAKLVLHVLQTVGLQKGSSAQPENQTPNPPAVPAKKPILSLRQHLEGENHYRVDITVDDGASQTTPVNFEFVFNETDRSDLRWYLEDYLQYPLDPAPQIAQRIEKRIKELGVDLFNSIFKKPQAARLWAKIEDRLDDTRVEVVTDVQGAVALPWELLCDPQTDTNIALRANAFVRAHYSAIRKAEQAKSADKVRILLVICRPGGKEDVPFRSVAGRLLKGLSKEARELFELDVLRPPTFEQLGKTLQAAKAQGKPYHIVHFDGHGVYLESNQSTLDRILKQLGMLVFGGEREGTHGYLLFENPKAEQNGELIDGPALGNLLVENDVPVLILNACRSAHADVQEKPVATDEINAQVRAFGSLAQEVMDAGVAGVVAMRYNVYVVTAAQFVADLYAFLAQGHTLGEAVSMGRKQLFYQSKRSIAFDEIDLQDWSVPVVYEAAPIQLFASVGATHASPLRLDLSKKRAEDNLPRPDVGFFGRDETILALDRAFDSQSIVLLHAYAGSGKTMTAAEFARWYSQTGGLNVGAQGPAPILFTSFEQYKPMAQVLSAVEETYRPVLEQNNIQWLALDEEQRLNIALQIFQQFPPLWIWDNVEPINGFPTGTQSAWSEKEQRELKIFMQIVTGQTRTKFLLTSRRDEQEWLGDAATRITLPPMRWQECFELVREIAIRQGHRITDVQDWKPLVKFAGGNPMTLTTVTKQTLRDGKRTKEQIEEYVQQLRNGEISFSDEASEGRSKSLGASLSYGFEQAFNEDERKVLALLHFFQGFVFVEVLRIMVNPQNGDWGLGMKSFTSETGIAILDKAADIGLLTAHGGGYYTIHPALPWFFKSLFEQYYPNEVTPTNASDSPSSSFIIHPSSFALRAYVESLGELGSYYFNQYEHGNRDVIASLRMEEPNLLHARSLARQHGWWLAIIKSMQGLMQLYKHTGRRAEWKRLVEEIVPDFVGADDLPLSGREEQWNFISQWRRQLFVEQHDFVGAENQIRKEVEFNRRNAASLLARPAESLNAGEKNTLRMLAVSSGALGQILQEQGKLECVEPITEQYELNLHINDVAGAAIAAFNLGHAYKNLPALRNLDEAERWYRRSLELIAEEDKLMRGKCHNQLGIIAHMQMNEAQQAEKSNNEIQKFFDNAIKNYQKALELKPSDDINGSAMTYRNLGKIFADIGDVENSLKNSNLSIHYSETEGNSYQAGETRRNVAIIFANNGRLTDALLYAKSALRDFESYQGRAKKDEDETKGLIGEIEKLLKG